MTAPLSPAFDYRSMDWLREKTERLRGFTTAVAVIAVQIGLELTEVRAKLKRRTFRAWIKSELPWSRSKVYNFMRVARVFGSVERIEYFQPSALYLLCWPAAPVAARQAALKMVENGEKVTKKIAAELCALHQPRPPETPDENDTPKPKLLFAKDAKAPAAVSIADRNWADLVDVLAEFSSIHITKMDDDENDDVQYCVTGYPSDISDGIKRVNKSDPGDAFAALLGDERLKCCPGPNHVGERDLPLERFCANATDKSGRNRLCRACESQRMTARAAAKSAPPPVPA